MTETDILLAELCNSSATTLVEVFFGFISMTSAFLAVGYFTAKKLSSPLVSLAVALYSITSLVFIAGAQRQATLLVAIREQMGENLSWHPVTYEAQWILPVVFFGLLGIMALLFVGSVWYFFYTRNAPDGDT